MLIIMDCMIREKSILTNKNNLEEIFTIKDFPVSMTCVPKDFNKYKYKYLDMTYQICKDTGIIQLKKYPKLEDMYIFQHNFSYGELWNNLFKIFSNKINNIINNNNIKNINILEIGGADCILANKIINLNDNIGTYKIYEKNYRKKNINKKICIIDKYFDNKTIINYNVNIILHSHVLEHVWDPVEFISAIKKNMIVNNYHCFIVPNIKTLFKKKYTNALNFEHNFFIIEEYIDIILNNNNFRVIEKEYYLDHSIMYITVLEDSRIIKSFPNLYEENKRIALDFYKYHINIIKKLNNKLSNFEGNIYLFGGHIFSQYLIMFGLNIDKIKCIIDNCPMKNKKKLYGTHFIIEYPNIIKNQNKVAIILKAGSYQNTLRKQFLSLNPKVVILE